MKGCNPYPDLTASMAFVSIPSVRERVPLRMAVQRPRQVSTFGIARVALEERLCRLELRPQTGNSQASFERYRRRNLRLPSSPVGISSAHRTRRCPPPHPACSIQA